MEQRILFRSNGGRGGGWLVTAKSIFTLSSVIRLLILSSALIIQAQSNDSFLQHQFKQNSALPAKTLASGRFKRQLYPVGGNSRSLSLSTNVAESGPWGPWSPAGECSRTCGGGVQIEQRPCSGAGCTGPSRRYLSCSMDDCEDGSDFRTIQCEKFNDQQFNGQYYKWKPATLGSGIKNKCELNCQPVDEDFFMKMADTVEDGTRCDSLNNDICIAGLCMEIGCDNKIGSTKTEDSCLVCEGGEKNCKLNEGFYNERNLQAQTYYDILTLPEGAMSVRIAETRATNNYLAIKNSTGDYVLNGDYQIQRDQVVRVAGTAFDYSRKTEAGLAFELLKARGPLTEELTIAVLINSQGSTGIKYGYSLKIEDAKYYYKPEEWSSCSVTCGKGNMTRPLTCYDSEAKADVEEALCEENNATKPEHVKECETVDCEAEWFKGEWEECSTSCGDTGEQYRVVYCHQVFANGEKITVDDSVCEGDEDSTRPAYSQKCNRFECPDWNAGPWSACSKDCGEAMQYRSVTCRSENPADEGQLLAASACGEKQPTDERNCNLGPCEGLSFQTSEWELCAKCNDTLDTRTVSCEDEAGKEFPLDKCEGDVPEAERPCNETIECKYLWHTSEWSDCSTECGHGHSTRSVYCVISDGPEGLLVMDESHCDPEDRPTERQNCTNEQECTGRFMVDLWSECSASCGGGSQSRGVRCFTWDFVPDETQCDEGERPPTEQICNTDPCPTCFDSEFGCCPDNSTFALGPDLKGCSNCSESVFGCCPDNYTMAEGDGYEGCLGFNSSSSSSSSSEEEGSGDMSSSSSSSSSSSESAEDCTIEENGMGVCANETLAAGNATFSNETLAGNETMENVTKTCKDSEFGCCPDWTTDAAGENYAGCPKFILGECGNDTAIHGCCQDNVTQARGPNLEGCGAESCSASVFGCCSDRRTIAFGPNYLGCERSNYPCEASEFGCCPDGETAALGMKGEGCGQSCLLTEFGCCPDGETAAEGPKNEGCGCGVAQYGCCPDGETAAKGPGYAGCPQSCATSGFGCCPDGKTAARGPNNEGCPCQFTQFGCCDDGETAARGPNEEGCDDCRYAKYGCCPGGQIKAVGPNQAGCPVPTTPETVVGGTVSPARILGCAQPPRQSGTPCAKYELRYSFDPELGKCVQFWFGGCDGNDNRFLTEDECNTVCVSPPGQGVCYLPKLDGRQECYDYQLKHAYNISTGRCDMFYYRGCGGNKNRFDTQGECERLCYGVGAEQRRRPQTTQRTTYQYPRGEGRTNSEPERSSASLRRAGHQQQQQQQQQAGGAAGNRRRTRTRGTQTAGSYITLRQHQFPSRLIKNFF